MTQHIWTGSELHRVDSDGLINVSHMTCNPYMVQTLLARQEMLHKELVECEGDDIARPSKTMVNNVCSSSFSRARSSICRVLCIFKLGWGPLIWLWTSHKMPRNGFLKLELARSYSRLEHVWRFEIRSNNRGSNYREFTVFIIFLLTWVDDWLADIAIIFKLISSLALSVSA